MSHYDKEMRAFYLCSARDSFRTARSLTKAGNSFAAQTYKRHGAMMLKLSHEYKD